jgi:hypothetical protein
MTRPEPRSRGAALAAAALAAAAMALPGWAEAQAVRGSVRSSLRYLEARTIVQDTVSRSRVTERPDGGLEFEGRPVVCLQDQPCLFYRPGEELSATALLQDVEASAWGLGVTGLSATVLLRHRANLAGDFTLPRTGDAFDAVLGYLELNRDAYRVRLGRQRTMSNLGFTGFDGLEVLAEPNGRLRAQGWVGRSLGRGVSESRQSALRGLDDAFFLPDHQAIVVGAELGADLVPGTSVALRYQSEIWADRGGMVSDRASLTARSSQWRPLLLTGSADYDFAFGRVGRAHLTAQLPVARNRVVVEATGRRYVPYFELWTIWGFFNPVAYHEGLLRATWRQSATTSLWAAGGYRRYGDHGAPVIFEPLHDQNWRAEVGGQRQLPSNLALSGSYRWEGPVGALLNSGDVVLAWRPAGRFGASLQGMLFEQAEEFRIGSGRVLGLGGSLDADLREGTSLAGGLDVFRQTFTDRPSAADWNQVRGWISLRIGFGRDAGAARRGTR